MSRKITAAAVQMDGKTAPTEARLQRAQQSVENAAAQGAELILLPELFNTGYSYSPATHYRAETLDGRTAIWMRETAARHNIYLAGSILLLDGSDIFNIMLLFAPDGRMWRYDKNYPWAWERGFFRGGNGITVAETGLGRIGLLICWDIGHAKLWQQYAGQVDLVLISSCPPDVGRLKYLLPNGQIFAPTQMAPMAAQMSDQAEKTFGPVLDNQVRWLNVPALQASPSGRFQSTVPAAKASLLAACAMVPKGVTMLSQADQLQITADFISQTKILDANGQIISQISAEVGEGFTSAEIELADKRPHPITPQPKIDLLPATYAFSDYLLPWLTTPFYRRGIRRAWGSHMAPIDPATRQRAAGLIIASALFLYIMYIFDRHR
jgi:predicted amidohydrolase